MDLKRIKVLSIFGTRPEANKMAPLIKEMEKEPSLESVICVTAQHRQMLDMALKVFGIQPDDDLNIMQEGQSLSQITSRALLGLEEVLGRHKPDLILVHGDPTTAFAASLAGFYSKIKIGHIEAGLRTYDKFQPFPEEINRKLIGSLADLHFAPTKVSKENLLKEGVCKDGIFVTGNTAIDALKYTLNKNHKFVESQLNQLDFAGKKLIAVTAHRRENIGTPLENICRAINRLTQEFDSVFVVYPVHPNPLVKNTVHSILGQNKNVCLTAPLDIEDMHNLINSSYFVMTDSGGLQEEAPSMNKPVLVLRNVTERPEGVESGVLKVAGTEEESIFSLGSQLLSNINLYSKMACAPKPFGDGNASKRITEAIKFHFGIIGERPDDF